MTKEDLTRIPVIHTTVNKNTYAWLGFIAEIENKTIAQIASELLEESFEEDEYLCRLVEEAERKSDGKTIPAEQLKRDLGLEENE